MISAGDKMFGLPVPCKVYGNLMVLLLLLVRCITEGYIVLPNNVQESEGTSCGKIY